MIRELYQELILDHNRHPRNFYIMDMATAHAKGYNPLCGDSLKLYVQISNHVIQKASFTGTGCAISIASASLLTESIQGKTCEQTKELFKQVHAALLGNPHSDFAIGKLSALTGVTQFPSRVKCATLAWHTLDAVLKSRPSTVTTE